LYPVYKLEAEGCSMVKTEKWTTACVNIGYKLTGNRGEKEIVNRLAEMEDFIRNMQSL
jgi:hypothetical protein